MKNWIAIGAVAGALAVVCGAFAAHALRERVTAGDLAIWQTSVLYHLVGSVALVLYGLFARDRATKGLAGWSFLLGTAIFSGSLYAMVLGGPRWLGAITPIGGMLLIAGWLFFAWDARRRSG